ncbi:MAG: TonB-dependent receptor [Robiginitomaculum sp.]|nr:TonB-dependent receptor [Robiginitomaculum sp.]MDQ7078950.1 TonB-dependent receptor [Robiginitomaculum sp.]
MKSNFGLQKSRLLGSVATGVALLLAVSNSAQAQEEAKTEDEVIVTGFRNSLASSIKTKRDEKSIVEVVTAEDIGKLPDVSIAESLARLPGLTTQRLDGRAQVLSIRGLGPDLSTALLNGREQVSTSDNRGVEFDQYPAELLASAVVYKTPYAGLIGQGLAGTVDLRTIRPLDHKDRILSANARYEYNNRKSLNPDNSRTGGRFSATYVDQFANDTVGIALGAAYQNTPTQIERFNAWGYPTESTGNLIVGGAKPFVETSKLERYGLIGTLEYEPNDNASSSVDLYYSNFDENQRLRGIEFPLQWSAAQLRPGFSTANGLVTEGVFDGVVGVMRNDINIRNAELFGAAWNGKYRFNESWSIEGDISYSRADRKDQLIESYSGTGYAQSGPKDSLGFALGPDGRTFFNPSLNYADPNLFVLTDPQGWGAGNTDPNTGNPLVQAGFINSPNTKDELTHLRASVQRDFKAGIFSDVEVGVDYGHRTKQRAIGQQFLTLPGGATEAAIPQEALLSTNTGLGFLGIPEQVTYDPLVLLNSNFYVPVDVSLSSFAVPQGFDVKENVFLGYIRGNIDSQVGNIPVSGNVGLQVVYTDQSSNGSGVQPPNAAAGVLNPELVPFSDGATYTDFLPSLNLIFDLDDNTLFRLGTARTLARARMDQLNASRSLSTNFTRLTSPDPNQGFFGASGGNAKLKPTISNSVDASLEHYFGNGAGYISVAGFYKDFERFVNPNDAVLADFSAFIDSSLTTAQQAQLGTPLGIVSGPSNRGKGTLKGVEVSLSVPLDLVAPALDGFGFLTSGSYTDSSVKLGDSTTPVTVPGLSKWVVNSTVYYEKGGYQARISHRYRAKFLAEVSGISATRVLRSGKSESIFDAQIGYAFKEGSLEGLTIVLQANNISNEPFVTYQNPDPRQVIDHQSFGRSFLFGASYTY